MVCCRRLFLPNDKLFNIEYIKKMSWFAENKKTFSSVGYSLIIMALTILVQIVVTAITNPEQVKEKFENIPAFYIDLIMISAGLLIGLKYSTNKRNVKGPSMFLFFGFILLVVSLIVARYYPHLDTKLIFSIWLPDLIGLGSVVWTMFSIND